LSSGGSLAGRGPAAVGLQPPPGLPLPHPPYRFSQFLYQEAGNLSVSGVLVSRTARLPRIGGQKQPFGQPSVPVNTGRLMGAVRILLDFFPKFMSVFSPDSQLYYLGARTPCSLTSPGAAAAGRELPDSNRPQTERRAARAATQRFLTVIGPQAASEGGTAMNSMHNAARVTPGDLLKSAIVQKVPR
jgi:hypothetical protein